MSSMPASAITSASPIFWQVMPLAPAAICSFASIGLLWVLICGRLAPPAVSQAAGMRAMLRSTRSMSMTAAGVPYSRAILAARGVVIIQARSISLLALQDGLSASETHQTSITSCDDGYRFAQPILRSLFDFFTQHFKFQPPVLGLLQFLLCFCKRVRGLVEFLPIFLEQIGIVKMALLFCDFGLQFGDLLRQRLQCVLFVEIEPPLRCA